MKKLLLACLLFTGWSQAQNITFKDPEFKKVLIGNSFSSVDQNNDSEISIQEAEAITTLYLPVVTLITSIDEIKYFKNLTNFYIEEAKITSIDLSNLPKLKYLHCTYSDISTIDLSKSLELEDLDLSISDKLTTIDVSKNIKLKALQIYNTKISTLDLSKNLELVGLGLNDEIKNLDLLNNSKLDSLVTGTGLEYLNLKNGKRRNAKNFSKV